MDMDMDTNGTQTGKRSRSRNKRELLGIGICNSVQKMQNKKGGLHDDLFILRYLHSHHHGKRRWQTESLVTFSTYRMLFSL